MTLARSRNSEAGSPAIFSARPRTAKIFSPHACYTTSWDSTNNTGSPLSLPLGGGFGDRPGLPPRQIGLALAPRIKAGKLETAVFPVWDPVCKRVVRVTAYRQKPAKAVKPAKKG